MKFVPSLADSLHPCRHLLYTFQHVSSYHNTECSERSRDRESCSSYDSARNRAVGSLQHVQTAVASSKPKYLRLDNEETFRTISYL